MQPLRRLMGKLELLEEGAGGSHSAVAAEEVKLDPVTMADVEAALAVTRPSAHRFAEKYDRWSSEFAST